MKLICHSVLYLVVSAVAASAGTAPVVPLQPKKAGIPRLTAAPKLQDFLLMAPSAEFEGKMLKVTELVQREPKDAAPASQPTEVYLGYDDKNFYAVFVCFDDPTKVRARLTRRDTLGDDDVVGLFIDTFHDHHHSYEFLSNPFGVQTDGSLTEGSNDDWSFDTLWYTEGKVTDRGYVVWMSIPFRSLRFSNTDEPQTWGISVLRNIKRENEMAFWPYMTRRVEGFSQQMADVSGIERVSPGRNVQFVPYGMWRSYRALEQRDGMPPAFTSRTAKLDGGLDAKAVIRNSFVLDTTVNPDFSQVESDDPQVTVNQRYEVYFGEKRPFFLENADYFKTPIDLFFTRRITMPTFGARLTGKSGPYSVGLLVADDRGPGQSVSDWDNRRGDRAYFAIARLKRDLGKQSSIGVMFTDREFAGAYNRVGGIDARLKLNTHWVADMQAVTSSTFQSDNTYLAGQAYQMNLRRRGRALNYTLSYTGRGTGFRTLSGFEPQNDQNYVAQTVTFNSYPEKKSIQRWSLQTETYANYGNDGVLLNWGVTPVLSVTMGGNTSFHGGYAEEAETLRPVDFGVLTRNRQYIRNNKFFEFESSYWKKFGFEIEYTWGRKVNYSTPDGIEPFLARRSSAEFSTTIRPVDKLSISNSYILYRLTDLNSPNAVFSNHIMRSKWNYQFTRAFAIRLIGQYNGVLPNPRLSGLGASKRFNADFLASWTPHPGTAVYLGYNSNLTNYYNDLRVDSDKNLLHAPNRFINDGRQIFVKIAYLFRY